MTNTQMRKEAAALAPMMRAPEAAAYLGLSPSTLAKMRMRGDGPAYSKAGRRIVVYGVADLDAYLAGRRRLSTSEDKS